MSEQKPEKKVVGRAIAFALGIIAAVLLVSARAGIGIAQSSDGISWVNRTLLLKPSDLGANITAIGDPFQFTDVNGNRYLYFSYYDGESKLGRIQLGALPPDVAITNITPSKTVVGQGLSTNINVTVANQGDYTETVNVTAYVNATVTGSQNVTLSAGDFATVTFTWNTTGFAYGNYTISAYAWPVPGETNTEDNNFTGGWVKVSIAGDIAGKNGLPDGRVDMKDIATVAAAFGSTPSSANWNANADLNNDGKVDMKDIAIVAAHFGNIDP